MKVTVSKILVTIFTEENSKDKNAQKHYCYILKINGVYLGSFLSDRKKKILNRVFSIKVAKFILNLFKNYVKKILSIFKSFHSNF